MASLQGNESSRRSPGLAGVLAAGLFMLAALGLYAGAQTPAGAILAGRLTALLALNSTQVTWYITRSAGWMAYLLLWFSVVWGLALPSKLLDTWLPRAFTYDFHQFLSLLAIAFMMGHIVVLALDHYLTFSVLQLLVPFTSTYRPTWVAFGSLAFYVSLLVTLTFYLRSRIGMKAFRWIHTLSLVGFFGAAVHGLMAGTDSPLPAALLLYAGTFLSVVFLSVYWILIALGTRKPATVQASDPRHPGHPRPSGYRPGAPR